MTYLNALQLVKDIEDFAETDEFGQELKEQAMNDSRDLRQKFDQISEQHHQTLFQAITSTFSTDL